MDYGLASLLPPAAAIVLALATRRVLLPLALGILVAAGQLSDGSVVSDRLVNAGSLFFMAIYESVVDTDHLMVLAFTLTLGAMVGVMETTGTMRAAISMMASKVIDTRGGQTLIAVTGLAVFFDDYANTLLVGGTMRTTADRLGISRAKLAYLVDSTAAPVAGLAIVSTWVATEISYLQSGIDASTSGVGLNAFEFFIASIPYRFYPWLAIGLVFMIARTGRDFGPMRREELKSREASRQSVKKPDAESFASASCWQTLLSATLPVLICLFAVLATLLVTGMSSLEPTDLRSDRQPSAMNLIRDAGTLIGSGNSYLALVIGGTTGLFASLAIGAGWSRCGGRTLLQGVWNGCGQMMPAMAVLWLAWALSAMTDRLDTGGYLSSLLTDRLDPRWLPTCVFVLAGAIAFSTGTSWGTMAILTPIAVGLVLDMQSAAGVVSVASDPIALATFSSVLAGAIFGDHCSPISDTTVLSSRASGCDHVVHVTTQMPYAILAGFACIVTGTIPIAFGVPVWLCLIAGLVLMYAVLRLIGD
ncbi:Na+/H+ antiporter NhaC family protein [Neorhodopirellula pilleata]|uniref:Na+/H+ antiporter family protein n=1 Tax=Neorhodopirellula pilleata TaxID=2714738 RepID=A0A5C6A7R6_9BACT|nr:Na+/H+ antiporter NhaC family protein [Neorhodopirellula pilleata]TWT94343.1 Na+/H+ antiporter family protein [Neorhodopirellula pilleata]